MPFSVNTVIRLAALSRLMRRNRFCWQVQRCSGVLCSCGEANSGLMGGVHASCSVDFKLDCLGAVWQLTCVSIRLVCGVRAGETQVRGCCCRSSHQPRLRNGEQFCWLCKVLPSAQLVYSVPNVYDGDNRRRDGSGLIISRVFVEGFSSDGMAVTHAGALAIKINLQYAANSV